MNNAHTYLRPDSVGQAVRLAAERAPDFRFIAGGTDAMVNRFQGADTGSCLIDLTGIAEMKQIRLSADRLQIGALVTLDELERASAVRTEAPLLVEAARAVATPVIRRTATLAGNLLCENRCIFYNQSEWWREAVGYCLKCNGDICIATGGKGGCFSKFVSDMAVALISLGASVRLTDKNGEHAVALEDLYTGDGVQPRRLDPTAVLHTIEVPLGRGFRSAFRKLRRRKSLEFSSLTSAVTTDRHGGIRIALGGVDPRPILVTGTAGDDPRELIAKTVKKARIIDNDTYPRLYRKEMIALFLRQSFDELG